MKIIRLEILNLASLDRQGGEVINFEEGALGDSNIFSIVGPTGSGKSTLLDAICLALYNRAPRYPKKPGERKQGIVIYGEPEEGEKNRPAPTDSVNILTRGKKTGYSKLTFKANNGNVYRAEWHVRFKSKAYGKPDTFLYLLTQENGQPKEETANWEDLPTIIGLDYDQFLRTVLIAQGTFANFLTAKEDERYKLLEKLIGCEEMYTNIAQKIKEQKDSAIQAYNEINANFKSYEKDLIPEEEMIALEKQIKNLVEEDEKVKKELSTIVKSLEWYTQEEQFLKNMEKYENEFNDVQKHMAEMKDEIDRLNLHDTTLPAVEYYREIKAAKEDIKIHGEKLKELGEQITEKKNTIETENKIHQKLKENVIKCTNEFEEQKPHINKARSIMGELDNAQRVLTEKENSEKEAKEAFDNAKTAVSTNATTVKNAQQALDDAETAYKNLKATIDEKKKEKEEAVKQATTAFNAVDEKYKVLDAATLQETDRTARQKHYDIVEAIKICQSIKEKVEDIKNNKTIVAELAKRNNEIDEQLSQLDTESLSKEVETLQKTYTLMTSENWQQHRAHLDDGKPCPLCGAEHHPYKNNEVFVPVITGMEKLIQEKRELLEKNTDTFNKLSKEKSGNIGTLVEKNNLTKSLNEKLNIEQSRWTDIHTKYPDWPADAIQLLAIQALIVEEEEKAKKSLEDYNELTKTINRLRKEKEKAEKAERDYKEQSDKELNEAEDKKAKANLALQTETGKTENLKNQEKEKAEGYEKAKKALSNAKAEVSAKKEAVQKEIGDKDPDTFEKQLQKAKDDAEEAVIRQHEKITSLQNEQKGLEGQVEVTKTNKKAAEEKLSHKAPMLDNWLNEYNAKPENQQLAIEDIALISESGDNWEAIRQKQRDLIAEVTRAKTTFFNENTNHDKHQEKKPADDKAALEDRKTELEQKSNTELVECKARMKRHEDAKKQMGELFQKRQDAGLHKKEWEEIADAIGGDGKTLRKIAQCYTLRFLIEHANVEIRKFNSRYELKQVKNSLGIRVIDHDRADDVRDTTSLSGGETFIVSLGLALGLSALSSRNISFENLFIDEGFGTLDHDTLETVINSLAMLQSSQGKKVGVISHTETMSRITTQIRVIRNGSSGSSHIEIYPS